MIGKRKAIDVKREKGSPLVTAGVTGLGTFGLILGFIAPIIGAILKLVSPELRKIVSAGLQEWYDAAKKTVNPWDNFLIQFIADCLGIPLV